MEVEMSALTKNILTLPGLVFTLFVGGAALGNQEGVMETTVKQENGKVWIDGVKGFSPIDYVSSVHGAQARILEVIGEPLDYDDLVCYSGFAFRTGVQQKMCPSAGHPFCGYMCVENGLRALPWNLQMFESLPWSEPKSEEARAAFEAEACAAIKTSIDCGVPVQYGGEEDGLIIGYADEGRRWWCVHPYYHWGKDAFWYDEADGFSGGQGKWPWGIAVWLEPKATAELVSPHELTLDALKQAVDMWHSAEKHGNGYYSGDAAYAHWLLWLSAVEAGEVDDPKAGMQGNGWYFDVLTHSRRAAARWLRAKAIEYDSPAREQLLIAANHYQKINDECLDGLDSPWVLCPGPDKFDEWTSEMRQIEIARLEAAREHDRAATQALALVIKALDQ